MQLTLYKMTCDKNVVDKSDYFISPDTIYVNGTLRENTNIVNPVVCIKFSNTQDNVPNNWSAPITKMVQYNYCHISEFGRWYFIDDIEWIGNGMHNLYLTIDVLYTFRTSILNLECGVTRNEFLYNPLLKDDMMPLNIKPTVYNWIHNEEVLSNVGFYNPNLDYKDPTWTAPFGKVYSTGRVFDTTLNKHNILLITASNRDSGKDDKYTSVDYETHFNNELFYAPLINNTPIINGCYHSYLIGWNAYTSLCEECRKDGSLADYVIGCYYFPFNLTNETYSTMNETSVIKIKNSDLSLAGGASTNYHLYMLEITSRTKPYELYKFNLNSFYASQTTIIDPRVKWTMLSPYSKYSIYLPFFGLREIDFCSFVNDLFFDLTYLDIYYSFDFFNGIVCCSIFNSSDYNKSKIFFSETRKLDELPLFKTNINEIRRNQIMSLIQFGTSVAATVITGNTAITASQLIGSKYREGSKNYKKLQTSIERKQTSMATDIANDSSNLINNVVQIEHAQITGHSNDSLDSISRIPKIILQVSRFNAVVVKSNSSATSDEIDKYAHIYGLPYCAIETLSNLHGYTVCADFHLDNIYRQYLLNDSGYSKGSIRPVSDELDMIEEYLKTGIILP